MNKIIMIIALVVSFMFETSTGLAQTSDSLKTITVKVGNLHCGNDMPTIKKSLLNQDGIDDVKFTDIANESSVFTISYHTAATDQDQIEKAIEATPGCDDKSETPYKVKRDKAGKKKKS